MERAAWRWLVPLVALLVSCPGSYDAPPDGAREAGTLSDGSYTEAPASPEIGADLYPWQDLYPPPDSYSGGPFGCHQASDCFGLTCCPTPWGVRLCAEVCQKP